MVCTEIRKKQEGNIITTKKGKDLAQQARRYTQTCFPERTTRVELVCSRITHLPANQDEGGGGVGGATKFAMTARNSKDLANKRVDLKR